MLYIITALYCEAKPLIQTYSLKKDNHSTRFQIFHNDKIAVIITKQGKLNAAIAVTELFHLYPPTKDSLLLNVGVAATSHEEVPIGSGFLCNKITDADTKKTYFPDVLFRHNFKEASLYTMSNIVTSSETMPSNGLIDMEASGIYTAATMFLKQHQIIIFKIVSDYGTKEATSLTADTISSMIEAQLPLLMEYTKQIQALFAHQRDMGFSKEEETLLEEVSQVLYCSVTMKFSLRQLFLYYKLREGKLTEKLQHILNTLSPTPCQEGEQSRSYIRNKKEGKMYIEQLKSELI